MRLLALLLLLSPVLGDEIALKEERAWRGVFTVRSLSREPVDGKGREEQEEKVEFVVVTSPPRIQGAEPRLKFELRDCTGSFLLRVDRTEGEGQEAVLTRGQRAGKLHPRVVGYLEPKSGRYGMRVVVMPGELVARVTMSGFDQGRFATFRTALDRRAFLSDHIVEGNLEEGGRVARGTKEFVDRKRKYPRDVTITWRLERVDPVIAGRVVDHLGRPVPDLEVLARTTNPARVANKLPPILLRARTDAAGRFSMDAFWSTWGLEVLGAERDGTVFEGVIPDEPVRLRFDDAPETDVTVNAYRLRALPDHKLLAGHFRGDVKAYLAYVKPRASEKRLRFALVAPPSER